MKKTRGSTLATLLILFALLTTMTFAVAYRFFARQKYARQLEYGTQADNLARSGLTLAIAKVRADPAFGTGKEKLERVLPCPADPQAGFSLSFDPSAAAPSFNNVRGDAPVPASSPVCPAGGLYLVSTGHCNGFSRTLRCLVAIPPFKYALASTGPIRSDSGLVLGSVPVGFDPLAGLDLSKLEPAEMMSASDQEAALRLRGRSLIVGNAKTAGTVEADHRLVEVRQGELLGGQTVDEIPDIDLSSLDFTSDPSTQRILPSTFADQEKVSGLLQWSPTGGEPLKFAKGLHLNGATLRVRGDLVIDGPLTGAGALLVDGDVIIRGGASLSADNKVAILSEGSVSITGSGKDASYVQGLVYAAGDEGIKLQDVTVVGTVLNNGRTPGGVGAPMVVERAGVVLEKGAVNFEVDLSGGTTPPGGGGAYNSGLGKPLPLTSFYRNGRWEIPSNIRSGVTPQNPYGLSPLELLLLPYLSISIDGKTYSSPEAALAAGERPLRVRAAVLAAAGSAGGSYYRVLTQAASQGSPAENRSVRFSLDLNRYLKTEGRLRIVRMTPGT